MSSESNKRLAKNTMTLYVRTLVIMGVSLFTSRIILQTLGIDNYGIYNIVGGFVALFGIVSNTLVSTTQRYLTFEIGKDNAGNVTKVFSASMNVHLILAGILILLFETIGLWFLNYKLNIPTTRLYAANWVYQCSILTFLINIISQPYNAAIIAYEKMSAFAYISLLEVFLKLGIVYMLFLSATDKLIVYGILLFVTSIVIRFVYSIYCNQHFKQIRYKKTNDKELYKNIFSFASYNFLGVFASILRGQGINILLNMFFGVAINAASGLATQVQNAMMKFVSDFMTALNPQITKSYASGDIEGMKSICYKGAKFSFFLLTLISIPILTKAPYILKLWLGNYPAYTVSFIICATLVSLIGVLSKPIITSIMANGNLKSMTFWIGGFNLLTLPLCYLVLKLGAEPYYVFVVIIFIEAILLIIRLNILSRMMSFSVIDYLLKVVFRVFITAIVAFAISYFIERFFSNSLLELIEFGLSSAIITIITISFLGINKSEYTYIVKIFKLKFGHK